MKTTLNYLLVFEIIVFGVLIGNYLLNNETDTNRYSKYYRVEVKELSDDRGWYYEIYQGNTLLIKQDKIPGVSGNLYFKSKNDAQKIAFLVVDKLEHHKMPSITSMDLDSCNIDLKK